MVGVPEILSAFNTYKKWILSFLTNLILSSSLSLARAVHILVRVLTGVNLLQSLLPVVILHHFVTDHMTFNPKSIHSAPQGPTPLLSSHSAFPIVSHTNHIFFNFIFVLLLLNEIILLLFIS